MLSTHPEGENPHDCTDLEQRSVRALTQCMTVLPEGGDVFTVVSESGSSYRVDARQGRCTCPDQQHNLGPDESCKHERRVAFATGSKEIPQWVNTDAVDPQLGDHVESSPSVVTQGQSRTTEAVTDGGTTVVSHEDTDTEKDTREATEGDENDDCDCDDFPDGCPCFSCYLEGAEFAE